MQNSVRTCLRFNIKQCRAETGEDWEKKYLWKASSVLVFKYFAISLFLKKIEEKMNSRTFMKKTHLMLKNVVMAKLSTTILCFTFLLISLISPQLRNTLHHLHIKRRQEAIDSLQSFETVETAILMNRWCVKWSRAVKSYFNGS